MVTIKEIEDLLDKKIGPLQTAIDGLSARVDGLSAQVNGLSARFANSTVGRHEQLVKVPLQDGSLPDGDYPRTLMELLVAGNEKLPDGNPNPWNKRKSRRLLKQYGVPADVSDGENEHSELSRTARLKLARAIGISQAQLNFAQLTL